MATLILEQDGRRRGAVVHGRTVIGRRANSHIVIADTTVSRVHAWIGRAGHTFFIADSGSRTGTLVNGRPVEGRRSLRDGDQIRIGPAMLTFFDAATLPPGIEPLLPPAESASEDGIFVYCDCGAPIWAPWEYGGRTGRCRHCGAHVALPSKPEGAAPADPSNDTMAGEQPSPFPLAETGGLKLTTDKRPKLRHRNAGQISLKKRRRKIAMKPATPPARISESDGPPRTDTICGACQSPIGTLEPTTTCPDCGVAFHADCWTENRGCSSYGCKQVGILAPPATSADSATPAGLDMGQRRAIWATLAMVRAKLGRIRAKLDPVRAKLDPVRAKLDPIWAKLRPIWVKLHPMWAAVRAVWVKLRAADWDPFLLPGSGLVGLAGVFAFGVPSLLIAIVLVARSVRRPARNARLVAAATIVSSLMAAVGSALSTYWWLHP